MKILIDQKELDFEHLEVDKEQLLTAETSVSKLKAHFFEALGKVGEIISVDNSWSNQDIKNACARDDTFIATFHERPPDVPCRLFQHTKGGLMLTGGFLDGWTFRNSTANIVETNRQSIQLKNALGDQSPLLGVFAQRLNTDVFRLPTLAERQAAREFRGIHDETFHLVYAGRWIANKGITQTVRCLNRWPLQNVLFTLIGDFEPDFFISQNGGLHTTFQDFFQREVKERSPYMPIRYEQPVRQETLAKHLWSADVFIYPSFHEDEASGNAAHEAVLCGVPSIVSDWCGLGQLGLNTRGGAIRTYPSLGGVRYSLRALRDRIGSLAEESKIANDETRRADADWVQTEWNPAFLQKSLIKVAEELLRRPAAPSPSGGWRCRSRVDRWAEVGPDSFCEAIRLGGSSPPDGLYVDGLGLSCGEWLSEPHFLTAIQAFYTTIPAVPIIDTGCCLRGFWRIALWKEERAIVEFGFPGPRVKRFLEKEWNRLLQASHIGTDGEPEFRPQTGEALAPLQDLVELGYLVPDEF
jgi:glycosyltransferase involved in cell wall biosynthesis